MASRQTGVLRCLSYLLGAFWEIFIPEVAVVMELVDWAEWFCGCSRFGDQVVVAIRTIQLRKARMAGSVKRSSLITNS
jgi:hypothetical protein